MNYLRFAMFFIISIGLLTLSAFLFFDQKTESSSGDVFNAYSKWKKTFAQNGSDKNSEHQVIAVSVRRINNKSAKIESLVVSNFKDYANGYDVKVEAQPFRKLTSAANNYKFEKISFNNRIFSRNRKSNLQNNVDIVALSRFPIEIADNATDVHITVTLTANGDSQIQSFLVPLNDAARSTATGRYGKSLEQLSNLNTKWQGLCKISDDIPSISKTFYNCSY